MTDREIEALCQAAATAGAERALAALGLGDADARDDVRELRELLGAWRDAKTSAWKATVDWLVRGTLALLLVGIALKMGFGAWVR